MMLLPTPEANSPACKKFPSKPKQVCVASGKAPTIAGLCWHNPPTTKDSSAWINDVIPYICIAKPLKTNCEFHAMYSRRG